MPKGQQLQRLRLTLGCAFAVGDTPLGRFAECVKCELKAGGEFRVKYDTKLCKAKKHTVHSGQVPRNPRAASGHAGKAR